MIQIVQDSFRALAFAKKETLPLIASAFAHVRNFLQN